MYLLPQLITLWLKNKETREITRPRIVNCPLIIDPEMVTLKKIMVDPQAGCISLMTSSNQKAKSASFINYTYFLNV